MNKNFTFTIANTHFKGVVQSYTGSSAYKVYGLGADYSTIAASETNPISLF